MRSMAIPICRDDEGLSGFIGFAAPDFPREFEAEKIPRIFVPAITVSLKALGIPVCFRETISMFSAHSRDRRLLLKP